MQKKNLFTKKENEILDVAEKLFGTKGYEKATVNNILDEVGIAKGTFYYYFESKEEVLDSVIHRVTETITARAQAIAANAEFTPIEKFIKIILALRVENEVDDAFKEILHEPENALTHQKSLVQMVTQITPILEQIVLEGINQGVFISEYPRQYIQIFLTAIATLLDDGIFRMEAAEQQLIIVSLASLLDKMLGVESGTFWKAIAKQNRE